MTEGLYMEPEMLKAAELCVYDKVKSNKNL